MALDDFLESEVAIAAAAAAVVFSPRVRGALRKGAVYGLAGVLAAGDAVGSFAQGVGRGARQAAAGAAGTAATAVPATAEDAADTLSAMASGGADETAPAERRPRRTARTEATGGEG